MKDRKKSRVALVCARDYTPEHVYERVGTLIEMLGGIGQFVSEQEKILLKPNLLAKAPPERACTTHPSVFSAVGKLLLDSGYGKVKYGDSAGGALVNTAPVAEACGIAQAAEALSIPMADFSCGIDTAYDGVTAKSFILCPGILEADAIINICKMKTHMLERVTGAVKNLFGAVYGINKGAAHVKYPNADEFAKMMADLNNMLRPRLHIMDGIVAMEGNGPQSGTPVNMNLLLASDDPVALDTVFCALVYLDPSLVFTNVRGHEYGCGTCELGEIEVVTEEGVISVADAQKKYGKADFDVYRGIEKKGNIKYLRFLDPFLKKKLKIDPKLCVGCGVCVKSCPVPGGAVNFPKNGKRIPVYEHDKCIKCYCCQEMCPQKAISLTKPLVERFADRNWKLGI